MRLRGSPPPIGMRRQSTSRCWEPAKTSPTRVDLPCLKAQILLAAHAGVGDEAIATSIGVGGSTVYRTKRRFVEGDLEAALSEEPRPGAERKLTGKEEALLIATACSDPPEGRKRWTLVTDGGEPSGFRRECPGRGISFVTAADGDGGRVRTCAGFGERSSIAPNRNRDRRTLEKMHFPNVEAAARLPR